MTSRLLKLNFFSTPAILPQECDHPNLKDCGGEYWWCLVCGERLTSLELGILRLAQAAKEDRESTDES